ncbi:MAG: alanine/glycine:cation symporter family protein [Porcipelethomonas sp.]
MIEKINNIVWGTPLLLLLLGTGLAISIRLKFFQLRRFGFILNNTLFSLFRDKKAVTSEDKDSISQFKAVSTALAAAMGTGNIAGVATALTIGGPGAIFWMWVSAILGMALVYAENYLGTIYRKKKNGVWYGGPMAYLELGTGKRLPAVLFAAFCCLASLGMGNMTQINSISSVLYDSFGTDPLIIGIAAALIAAAVISGGIKRIGSASQIIIPVLSLAYISAALFIIMRHYRNLPEAFGSIFKGAFGIAQAGGGISGAIISRSISTGLRRGVFSNEAGLGSCSLLHSSADGKNPEQLGMWAVTEVFIDTIICCTVTALAVLSSGVLGSGKDGAPLVTEAFRSCFGSAAPYFIAAAIALFAFATIIGWFYCGECSVRYLFGSTGIGFYKFVFIAFIIIGSVSELEAVWAVSDIFNGLMAIPNLTGLIILRKKVTAE